MRELSGDVVLFIEVSVTQMCTLVKTLNDKLKICVFVCKFHSKKNDKIFR